MIDTLLVGLAAIESDAHLIRRLSNQALVNQVSASKAIHA